MIIFKDPYPEGFCTLDGYRGAGGYRALEKALSLKPERIIDKVKESGLRGRGGAGFPTGVKWGFVPKDITPRYLCCNADEGEPGTFKDREIMERYPHTLLEGIIISAYAIGASTAIVYIRGEYADSIRIMEGAIDEAYDAGYIGRDIMKTGYSLDLSIYRGAGAYICGEETALLESVEGRRPQPRVRPPFPAVKGLYQMPTVINNVETLANIPFIIEKGVEAFRRYGTDKSPGTKIFSISGGVRRPGNYEAPLGIRLKELIDMAGGTVKGRGVKAVIPGGVSAPMLPASFIDITMDFESLKDAGSMLGSGGVIVIDDTQCIVKTTLRIVEFFFRESCGKCTPCREGTYWLKSILERIEEGRGRKGDIPTLKEVCSKIQWKCLCALGEAAAMAVSGAMRNFEEEFILHIKKRGCEL